MEWEKVFLNLIDGKQMGGSGKINSLLFLVLWMILALAGKSCMSKHACQRMTRNFFQSVDTDS